MSIPEDWVTLRVPDGMRGETWTYPPSHGTDSYTPFRADHTDPDSDWYVHMPGHAAAPLLHTGGYTLVNKAQDVVIVARAGFARLRNSAGTGCSWGGASFEPDEDGVISVPAEAVPDLQSHGFMPAPPKTERLVPRHKGPAGAP